MLIRAQREKFCGRKQKHSTFQCYGHHRWSLIFPKSRAHCWCLNSVKRNTFIFLKIYFHFDSWLIIVFVCRPRENPCCFWSLSRLYHLRYVCSLPFESSTDKGKKNNQNLSLSCPGRCLSIKKLWSISLKVSFHRQSIKIYVFRTSEPRLHLNTRKVSFSLLSNFFFISM